jgi:hypothetical protein
VLAVMRRGAAEGTFYLALWPTVVTRVGRGDPASFPAREAETGMERTDWLDQRLDPADARFLMLTAITHHRFTSPVWGVQEVRKLHAELAELDMLAIQAVREHTT